MSLRVKQAVVAVALSVAVAGAAWAQSPESAVKERQDLMKSFGEWNKTLAASAKAGTADAATATAAEGISAGMKKLPALFPAGTGSDKLRTRAKPEIWAGFDKFEGYTQTGGAAFAAVAAAAKSGDGAAVRANFTKAAAVCSACHRDYRGPEPK